MTLLFLILAVIAVLALLGSYGGRSWSGPRPGRRIVQDTYYEDEPASVARTEMPASVARTEMPASVARTEMPASAEVPEIVEEEIVEDDRTVRRRTIEY